MKMTPLLLHIFAKWGEAFTYIHIHTYVRTYMQHKHTYTQFLLHVAYIHAYMRTCISTHTRYICVYTYICLDIPILKSHLIMTDTCDDCTWLQQNMVFDT